MAKSEESRQSIKTSIVVPFATWKAVRLFAAEHDLELQDVVNEALEKFLKLPATGKEGRAR